MDLYQDWNKYLAQKLDLKESEKDGAHYYYFQSIERNIEEKPRKFYLPKGFTCPKELTPGFSLFKDHVETGKNLKPFLSKRLISIDPLFAQWNIRHFHLGNEIINGFIKRTGPLAFAKITSKGLYILGIAGHGEWSKKEFIQTAHANWPFLLEGNKLTTLKNSSASGTQEEIDQNRSLMISTNVKIDDGTEYLFGDMTGSGHNIFVNMACSNMIKFFAIMESKIKDMLMKDKKYINSTPKFNVKGNKYYVTCDNTGFLVDITDALNFELNRSIQLVENIEK